MEILDDDDGAGALFGGIGSSGCVTTCSVRRTIAQPMSPPSDEGLGVYGGGFGSQDKYDCKFPRFNQLTAMQQNVLGNEGESIYSKLSNRHRANFLNLTARAAQIGLDFGKLTADPATHVDRLILTGEPGLPGRPQPADILKASHEAAVKARKMSDSPPSGHDGMNEYGGRQKGLTYSLQLGINKSRTGAFVDIDYYNPGNGLLGAVLHGGEVFVNWAGKKKTDAFRIGRHLGSKLTKYDCKKIKK